MSLLALAGTNSATGRYDIDNSVKLEADNGEKFISSQFSSAGNQKTWTVSFWVKITELGAYQMYWGSSDTYQYKGTDDKMYINFRGASENFFLGTNRVFRDTSAWYHFVVVCDATNSTNVDRGRLYINGVRETDYQLDTYNNMDGNDNTYWNGSNVHSVGGQNGSSTFDVSGYMAEFHSVDGQALDPTDFGEFDTDTGIWKPKAYTGSYGTNGFYLDFENASDLGDDVSGNSKAFTNTNITSADQATDTPTNNFTTFNCVRRFNSDNLTVKDGGTVLLKNSTSTWTTGFNTIAVNKGKWYWEGELYANEGYQMFGQTPQEWTELNVNIDWYLGSRSDKKTGAGYYGSGEDVYYEGGYVNSSASTAGDIISVAMDCDNNKVHFAVNGVYTNSSDPVNNTNGFAMLDEYQYFAMATFLASTSYRANFGGYAAYTISSAAGDADGYGTFEHAPPSGYYALCSKNLEEYG